MTKEEMSEELRLRTYAAMVEADRKWISTMDAKASLLCALNAAILALIWSGAKFGESPEWGVVLAARVATGLSVVSLWMALKVVLPTSTLQAALSRKKSTYAKGFKPLSYYGYVATAYGAEQETAFCEDLMKMTLSDLAREAVEQHFTISRIIYAKSDKVSYAGWLWMLSSVVTLFGFVLKA